MTAIGTTPTEIAASADEVEVSNTSEGPVYYGLTNAVSTTSYEGVLAPGTSLLLGPGESRWFIATITSEVSETPLTTDFVSQAELNSEASELTTLISDGDTNTLAAAQNYSDSLMASFGRVTGSNFTTTSGSFVDITGLTVPVGANEVWRFDAVLTGQCSTVNGVQFSINGPSGATLEVAQTLSSNSFTGTRSGRISALDGTIPTAWAVATTDLPARLTGVMVTSSTAGTLAVRGRASVGGDTLTVYQGSHVLAMKIT